MAFTSHGHHIAGTVLDERLRPAFVARCGGPRLCAKCSYESARVEKTEAPNEISHTPVEPRWQDGCQGDGFSPKAQCDDCKYQRALYGYSIVNGSWVKTGPFNPNTPYKGKS